MSQRWMAKISYRTGRPTQVIAFEELHDLHEIVERGPNWNEIEHIVITLNRRSPLERPERAVETDRPPNGGLHNTDDDLPWPNNPPTYFGWKLPLWLIRLIEYSAGPKGEYYHSHWMAMHHIPPVPIPTPVAWVLIFVGSGHRRGPAPDYTPWIDEIGRVSDPGGEIVRRKVAGRDRCRRVLRIPRDVSAMSIIPLDPSRIPITGSKACRTNVCARPAPGAHA